MLCLINFHNLTQQHATLVLLTALCMIQMTQATCGGNFTGVTGMVNSGYDDNMDCTYLIFPPSQEYTYLQLSMLLFVVENGWDYVYIYDGPSRNSELLATLTGEIDSYPLQTSQPYATIVFKTDNDVTDYGFTMRYDYQTGKPPSCAGN